MTGAIQYRARHMKAVLSYDKISVVAFLYYSYTYISPDFFARYTSALRGFSSIPILAELKMSIGLCLE